MRYDTSMHSMREYITYDFESKFASDEQQLKHQAILASQAYEKENKQLHEKHKKETINIWENIK